MRHARRTRPSSAAALAARSADKDVGWSVLLGGKWRWDTPVKLLLGIFHQRFGFLSKVA